MHRQTSPILLINCLRNYLKHILLGKFYGGNPQGKSMGKFHTTTNDHYKNSDFVLAKPLVSFHGQVNKT